MKHIHFPFLALVAWLLCATAGSATVRFVKAGATGNGLSWADASGDLQAVINASAPGDTVWVAAGTYTPNRPADNLTAISPGNRTNAFVVKEDIHLFGGFAGTETELAQRTDAASGATNRALSVLAGDNVYHVIIFVRTDGATLDGFT
ncbi:MAG: hypothetical protein LBN71_00995, partial [Tannerella sp.]|nr:hypothetical protein [Tannerella sp.]